MKLAGFGFTAEEPLTHQVMLIDRLTRSCFCERRGLLLLPTSGSAGAALLKGLAGSEALCLFNDRCVFHM